MKKAWDHTDRKNTEPRRQNTPCILSNIALTVLQPEHKDAYKKSCHWFTAKSLRKGLEDNSLTDTDEIVLLGIGQNVFHSIIVRGNDIILSDNTSTLGNCSIDLANQKYHSDYYETTNPGGSAQLQIVGKISLSAFREQYLDDDQLSTELNPNL